MEAQSPSANKDKEEFLESHTTNGNANSLEKEGYNESETGINSIEAENENSEHANDDESVQLDDEQSNAMNTSATPIEMESEPLTQKENLEQPANPVAAKKEKSELKKFFDNNLINFISANIQDTEELKDIVLNLGMTQEKLVSIEKETSNLVEQAKKIFQFWTVNIAQPPKALLFHFNFN